MDSKVSKALKFNSNTFKVNEIFASVQGEGVNTGVPAIFIRFALCNLSCQKCDSSYTWNWIGTTFKHNNSIKYDPQDEITEMTFDDLFEKVKKLADKSGWMGSTGYTINHVVITGGEPLLHLKNHDLFKKLLQTLRMYRFFIEIETNGTILPPEDIIGDVDQFNVSPKLSSFFDKNKSIKLEVLKAFAKNKKAYFKFVITNKKDIEEVKELQKECEISSDKILLMPEGISDEVTKNRAQELVKLCLENGYRFCNRLHIWIWEGIKRGV